ncbi:MAG TPA: lysylphosphatidylglycerol synthase transmembrane domain-containing protein [Candidatus Thermoplasmatota archaeon]|nr:lysylphosphatidylglycerol synthase transmembrane domain-containing protein [Candidatus Thermoplasmatota archaeon]
MDEPKKKTGRVKLYTAVSLTLSLTVIILVLYFTFNKNTVYYLTHTSIRYEFFLLAILLNICSWILWGYRLQVLANGIDKDLHIGLWESTKIVIANLFLSLITPGLVGGEPIRIYLLTKDGMKLGGATAAILGERLIDAVCVLIAVPFAFYIFKDRLGNSPLTFALLIGMIIFIGFLLIVLYGLKNPEKIKSTLIFLNNKINRLFRRNKEGESSMLVSFIEKEVDNFHSSMMYFSGQGKKTFLFVIFLTLAYWGVCFMIASMLLMGLGLPPFFLDSYAAQMLLVVIVSIPTTPGSSGVAELSMTGMYGVILGASYGYLLGVFVILFRFVTYYMNLTAGAIFQYKALKSLTSFSFNIANK